MKKISLLFLVLSGLVFGQYPTQSFRVFPSVITQSEPVIAISKTDTNLLFISAVTINTATAFKSEGVYVSTDGGISWFGTDTCRGANIQNHAGDPGTIITPSGRLILTHNGLVFPGLFSHYSDDLGKTWSSAYTISPLTVEDKSTSIIDDEPSSPYYGRLYAVYVNMIQPYPVLVATSTNSGSSWTTPVKINPTPPSRSSGGSIVTDTDGTVFVSWAGVIAQAPFTEDYVGFAKSTDGGASWSVNPSVYDANGINGVLTVKSGIRVNGLPRLAIDKSNSPHKGRIYIVTTEKNLSPAGTDPDVILHYSDDKGNTWSSGIRVNQDVFNNGRIQYFPAIDVDDQGGVNIIFCDDRNTSSDSSEVFLARSVDGGITWNETLLSDHRFKPVPIIGGASNYQGDNITLMSSGRRLYAVWMDNSSGLYQLWMRIIQLEPTSVSDETNESVQDYTVVSNYPNPFNPETTISFNLKQAGDVTLRIFDALGREVETQLHKMTVSGSAKIPFNAGTLPSGAYFYQVISGSQQLSGKMMLIR